VILVADVTDVALEWAERNVKSNQHISELIEIRKVTNCQGTLSIEDSKCGESVDGKSKMDGSGSDSPHFESSIERVP
jgi:23S rRNA (adenine1618-N6)-methyltransferase